MCPLTRTGPIRLSASQDVPIGHCSATHGLRYQAPHCFDCQLASFSGLLEHELDTLGLDYLWVVDLPVNPGPGFRPNSLAVLLSSAPQRRRCRSRESEVSSSFPLSNLPHKSVQRCHVHQEGRVLWEM